MNFDQKTRLLNWIGYSLIAAGCLGSILTTRADDVKLDWTNPTGQEQCTDAGPLTTLAGTRIWELVAEIDDPATTTVTLNGKLPGDYQYVATSYTTDGEESRVSGKAEKTVTQFTAATGAVVYQPVSIANGFWLLPVGTVSADVECIINQNVNGKYAVPTTSVSWSSGVVPKPLVVADCV